MSTETPTQPRLTDLLARFLNKQAQAEIDGLVDVAANADVTPYDAGPVQPIDAKLAWEEAVAAAPYFYPGADTEKWPPPPHWGSLVGAHEPAVAIAFCLGNFPQLVRDFHSLVPTGNLSHSPANAGRPIPVPALAEWSYKVAAQKQYPQMLVALCTLRLANNFDQAADYLAAHDALIPREWRSAWENEKAALAWHRGRTDAAREIWNAMEASVPVLFNRGMAELFTGNIAKGSTILTEVVSKLPDTSAWHHLAGLYLLLGSSR